MEKAPTYQDLARQKAEQSAIQEQASQANVAANEAQATVKPNPILQEYIGRSQQGLVPANQYTAMATRVADAVPDQASYSQAMIDFALKGEVPIQGVLSDDSVLPEYRNSLMQTLESSKGLGNLGR